jgi:hypothetical protein
VHPALDRRRQIGAALLGDVLALEVDDADVLDPHLVVVVVARGDGVEPAAGDPDRDVPLGRLEVAAVQHGPAHVYDVLAGDAVLHDSSPLLR